MNLLPLCWKKTINVVVNYVIANFFKLLKKKLTFRDLIFENTEIIVLLYFICLIDFI